MRSFYIDDNDDSSPKTREFFVKVENISIADYMKSTQIITSTSSPIELKDRIMSVYGFNEKFINDIQLWSGIIGSTKRIRLDTLEQIPIEYDTVFIRGVLIKDIDNSITSITP